MFHRKTIEISKRNFNGLSYQREIKSDQIQPKEG